MKHVVIIGNGISGVTAARHIRKLSNHRITVISGESEHFFSRTALMYIYMGHMKYEHTKPYEDRFWAKNRIELKKAWVELVNTQEKRITFQGGETMDYDSLILATGSKSNKFGWPGQDLDGVGGLYSLQDLENMEKHTQNIKQAVIVGGGLIGVEMAEMLLTRNIKVIFLVREDRFWGNVLPTEEGQLIARHITEEHHIDLRLNTELKEILADHQGRARAVITGTGEEIPCQFVGLTAGVSPNVDFLKNSSIEIQRGILVNEYLETNVPDVYAIGDCAQRQVAAFNRRPIEQVWYTGRMMGEIVAKTVAGNRTAYNPGYWFNSAKFFDIEYQTYGWVFNELLEGEKTFYWESKDHKKCLRINYKADNGRVNGMNIFGMRQRHEVWDQWLQQGRNIDFVLENLPTANFDPEFFKQYEAEIIEKYNRETGKNLKIKTKKGLFAKIFA
ncbi:MAG: FAD/NAD(P)-binding oxidoreductase [Microscillaceae bacterium]|nr:FAD/NAD(P)-binding oxidoreductase [Microscillaceae bacterium]